METSSIQRVNALSKALGLDSLSQEAYQAVDKANVAIQPMLAQLEASNDYATAAQHRLIYCDRLIEKGALAEAYRFGHAALKAADNSVSHVLTTKGEILNQCGILLGPAEKAADDIKMEIFDMASTLPDDVRRELNHRVVDAARPLSDTEARLTNAVLDRVQAAYLASTTDKLRRALSTIEAKAQATGVALPSVTEVSPLDPLPPFNAGAVTQEAPAAPPYYRSINKRFQMPAL